MVVAAEVAALAEVAPMAVRVVAPVAELEGAEGQLAAAVLLVAPEPEALGPAAWVAAAPAAAAGAGVAAAELRSQLWVAAGAADRAGSRTLRGQRS